VVEHVGDGFAEGGVGLDEPIVELAVKSAS